MLSTLAATHGCLDRTVSGYHRYYNEVPSLHYSCIKKNTKTRNKNKRKKTANKKNNNKKKQSNQKKQEKKTASNGKVDGRDAWIMPALK